VKPLTGKNKLNLQSLKRTPEAVDEVLPALPEMYRHSGAGLPHMKVSTISILLLF
jgi:hypothetical protein